MSLYNLLSLLLLGLMVASLELLYQYTIQPGEIFGRYGLWLNYRWLKSWRRKDRWKRYLLKPFICQYCNSVYLSAIVYFGVIEGLFTGYLEKIIGLFLFMGVVYIWVKILDKIK
jgi:hypothetical protein